MNGNMLLQQVRDNEIDSTEALEMVLEELSRWNRIYEEIRDIQKARVNQSNK